MNARAVAAALGIALVAEAAAAGWHLLWEDVERFDLSRGYAVVVSPEGTDDGLYVAGSFKETNWFAVVRKLGPFGVLRWTFTRQGSVVSPDAGDAVRALAFHPSGDLIVGGRVWNGAAQHLDGWLARCTPVGATAWSLDFNGAYSGSDSVESVSCTLSPTGDIWAAGRVGDGAGQGDLWVGCFTDAGGIKTVSFWPDAYGLDDSALAVVAAPSGSAYAAGYVSLPGRGKDIWIGKFSKNAALLGYVTIDGTAGADDYASGLALEPDGTLVVTGATTTAGRNLDAWIGHFADSGTAFTVQWLWSVTLDGGEGDNDLVACVATDPAAGAVFVTGMVDRPTSVFGDVWTAAFSPAGALTWEQDRDFSGHYQDEGRGIAYDAAAARLAVVGSVYADDNTFRFYTAVFENSSTTMATSVIPTGVRAYPHPYRPGSGGGQDAAGVVLNGTGAGATVRIYTLRGELVAELTDTDGDAQVAWDGTNQGSGKAAASGVYVYIVTPLKGSRARGKLVIVR